MSGRKKSAPCQTASTSPLFALRLLLWLILQAPSSIERWIAMATRWRRRAKVSNMEEKNSWIESNGPLAPIFARAVHQALELIEAMRFSTSRQVFRWARLKEGRSGGVNYNRCLTNVAGNSDKISSRNTTSFIYQNGPREATIVKHFIT